MRIDNFFDNFSIDYTLNKASECQCFSNECVVRSIWFFDFFKNHDVSLKVCNSLITLFFENTKTYYGRYCSYSDLVEYLIDEYYKKNYNLELQNSSLPTSVFSKQLANFTLSKRPFIYRGIYLTSLLELLIEQKHLCSSSVIIESIIKSIDSFFIQNKFNKNKTLKEDIFLQTRKLKKNLHSYNEVQIIEIINKILTLTIKNK